MQHLAPHNPAKSKLAELRAKTDRQLIALIHHKLDSALAFCSGSRAQRAHADARALLACVDGITQEKRARIEAKLASLGRILEEESTLAAHATCC